MQTGLAFAFVKEVPGAFAFDEFWLSGPWQKLGKKEAKRHWNVSVKTERDWKDIQSARDRYGAHLKSASWLTPQYGSTWFNNWRDWVNFEPAALPHAITPLARPDVYCEGHYCDLCAEPHEFACLEPEACGLPRELACPEFIIKRRVAEAAKGMGFRP